MYYGQYDELSNWAKLRYGEKGFDLGTNSMCNCFSIDIKNYEFRTDTKMNPNKMFLFSCKMLGG